MKDRNWPREVAQLLEASLVSLCETLGQPFPRSGLRIVPPLEPDEAEHFVHGADAGLFHIDSQGYILSPLLTANGDKTKKCQMFWHDPPPPRLIRERVCQLATAAALVLERGWQRRQVEIDPATVEEDSQRRTDVDLLVKATSGELFAAVEIKRSVPELAKLRRDFYQCCKRGKHPEAECGFPQNHAKYEFCAAQKPLYLWAVAPGEDICFKLSYLDNGRIELEELPMFPPRSVIELQNRDA